MAGLIRRIFVWQLAPLRSRAQDPQHPVEHLPSVLPRTSTAIGTALGLQQRLQLRPLPLSHLPASSHPRLEDPPALVLLCRYSCQTARRKKFQTIYETGPRPRWPPDIQNMGAPGLASAMLPDEGLYFL